MPTNDNRGESSTHAIAERDASADGLDILKRREVLGITAGGLAAGAIGATGSAAADENDPETITILHDTHTHSEIGEVGSPPNIATYVSKLEELLDEYDNPIVVGNGDDLGPSIYSLFTEGEHIIDFLNEGYHLSANAVGNHEFDYGAENATEQFERSDFTWVSADLGPEADEPVPGAERWMIEEVNGVNIGIFGLGPENIAGVTSYPDEWVELDKLEAAQEATEALKEEGADVVVCASHTDTPVHFDLAEELDDLDAIVGSHWALVYDEDEVWDYYDEYGTVISEVGDEFDYIGAVTLDAETGDLVDWDMHPTEDAEEDPDIVEMMNDLEADIEEELGEPVGRITKRIAANRPRLEVRETPMGNLAGDMMISRYENAGADFSFYNPGGFRGGGTYPRGEMTMRDWSEVFAFGNNLVLFEVDGATIIEMLESRGVPATEGQAGGPDIQVGGIQFEWNPHGESADGSGDPSLRVDNVYINGEPLDPDRTYRGVTIDFLKDIGGGFEPIHDLPTEDESDVIDSVAMAEYFQQLEIVSPRLDNRLLRVDEDIGTPVDVDRSKHVIEYVFPAPETGEDVYSDTFRAVSNNHDSVPAETAWLEDESVHVVFDAKRLRTLATGPEYVNLRVFGGYEPDPGAYEYDTPGTQEWEYHQLKGTLDPQDYVGVTDDDLASLQETITTKEQEIDDLEEENANQAEEIQSLENEIDEKSDELEDLESDLQAKDEEIDDLEETIANWDADDDSDDGMPGFGPLAALAGAGAGAYGYKRLTETDTDAESE